MFAIISGLEHRTVKRLKETWKLVPPKYIKLKDEMFLIMDPSMNFRRYRNLIQNTNVRTFLLNYNIFYCYIAISQKQFYNHILNIFQPPKIPIYPMVCKDFTFIDLGNESKIEGLINFEKLRMLAKEVRVL